jgi:two-component system, chemotaxis family, CheB/CheR fusion protein
MSRLRGIYVLFVDDNADARYIIDVSLEHEGAIVEVAASAAEAMVKAGIVQPDIIVTDLTMPGIDGYAFLAKLKESRDLRGIPVIAVTGVAGPDQERIGRTAGFADMVKPIDPDAMAAAIVRVIGRSP